MLSRPLVQQRLVGLVAVDVEAAAAIVLAAVAAKGAFVAVVAAAACPDQPVDVASLAAAPSADAETAFSDAEYEGQASLIGDSLNFGLAAKVGVGVAVQKETGPVVYIVKPMTFCRKYRSVPSSDFRSHHDFRVSVGILHRYDSSWYLHHPSPLRIASSGYPAAS